MTYSVVPVSNITDIPVAISNFAVGRGWSSSGGGVITNPVSGQTYTVTAGSGLVTAAATGTAVVAAAKRPFVGPDVIGVGYEPTQVHLFGNNSPYASPDSEPYIVCVIEFEYNRYRHFYFGGIVKAGGYTHGDLFSCNNHSEFFSSVTSLNFESSRQRNLFRGFCNGTRQGGAAKITHVNNANTWREFSGPISTCPGFQTVMDGTEIYGGNCDGINDGRVYRGSVNFGSAQLLVPVSLYMSKGNLGVNYRFIPVGHVSGARLVDMFNLTPGQQCLIGGTAWRVFPEFRKSTARTVSKVGTDHWSEETSHFCGLAYKE